MGTYVYEPLQQDEIRLLELHGSEEGSDLVANLLIRRLLDDNDEELRADGTPSTIPLRVTDTSWDEPFAPPGNLFPTPRA